jgi:hypothetical protein
MVSVPPLGAWSGGALVLGGRPDAARTSAGSRRGAAALGGLVVGSLLLTIAAPGTDALLPQSVRPVPAWLAGPFGSAGVDLGGGGVIAVLVAMFASYAVVVYQAERLSPRVVLATIAALNALVLLAPPLLSTDVFSYQTYARMWVTYGANPYLHGPSAIALDPLYPYVDARWVSTPSAYGPLFTLLGAFVAQASVAASVMTFKVVAALSSLGCVALLWHAAQLRGLCPVRAGALFGLNPLVVVYGVGGGHNDLLMLVALSAALWALLAGRERAGGAAVALSAAVKLTSGLVLPFALAADQSGRGARGRRHLLAGFALTGLAIAVAAAAVFGSGPLHLPATLLAAQQAGESHSIAGATSALLGAGAGRAAGWALGAAFLAITAWLAHRAWRGTVDWIDGAAWATLALLVSASSLMPWYIAWLLPLVALCADRRLWRAALLATGAMQAVLLPGYLPHGALGL